jgi:hypothetical protein
VWLIVVSVLLVPNGLGTRRGRLVGSTNQSNVACIRVKHEVSEWDHNVSDDNKKVGIIQDLDQTNIHVYI